MTGGGDDTESSSSSSSSYTFLPTAAATTTPTETTNPLMNMANQAAAGANRASLAARRAAGLYFVWDLEVADDWLPRAADGEVERFERWSMQRVEHEVREGDCLRPAMRLVMADFLIRHGVITPDNEPDFERIVLAMHQERLVL